MSHRYLEILDFTQFFDHFVFTPNAENVLEKELKREIPVSVGIELVAMDMLRNGKFMGKITFLTVKAERVFYFIGNFLNRQK